MTNTVRSAVNARNIIGFNVTTTDHIATAVVSSATLATSGCSKIFRIRGALTVGDVELFFNVRGDDPINSDANAAQADVVVTDISKFTAGDHVLIYDNTYTNKEYRRVSVVTTGTSTLTMSTVLANNYTKLAGAAHVLIIPHANAYAPIPVSTSVSEDGLNIDNVYIRKMQAGNPNIKGYMIAG